MSSQNFYGGQHRSLKHSLSLELNLDFKVLVDTIVNQYRILVVNSLDIYDIKMWRSVWMIAQNTHSNAVVGW